eukprot:15365-Heterococcus_DN1.PRE.2
MRVTHLGRATVRAVHSIGVKTARDQRSACCCSSLGAQKTCYTMRTMRLETTRSISSSSCSSSSSSNATRRKLLHKMRQLAPALILLLSLHKAFYVLFTAQLHSVTTAAPGTVATQLCRVP